jgi:DNA-binding response OmpR family regulator
VTRILVVEDEERISSFLEKGLRANGYVPTVVDDGGRAAALLRTEEFDLVVLDIGLPGRDGYQVLEDLRGRGVSIPVVILTARDDVVGGFERGADDYVTKPFRFEELLARIRARLRPDAPGAPTTIVAGDCELDLLTRTLVVEGQRVELTAREFALAEVFLRHPGQVLSREQLLSLVWGYDYDPGSNVVDVYIRYLRKKLGDRRIVTVRGMGYRFEALA